MTTTGKEHEKQHDRGTEGQKGGQQGNNPGRDQKDKGTKDSGHGGHKSGQ